MQEGNFIKNFKQKQLQKSSLKDSEVDQILSDSKRILSKCLDDKNLPNNQKGIVIGKIQSGKTLNYISLINLAFDNHYDIGVIFSGMDNEINDQTRQRIEDCFNDSDLEVQVVNSENAPTERAEIIRIAEKIKIKKEKLVLVVLKNAKHLEKLLNLFSFNSPLTKKNILIIDDEADLASLDGNKYRLGKEQTKINKQISQFIKSLKYFSFLAFTATPYANLFLELKDDLSPQFLKLIKPGSNYFGLEELFDEQNKNFFVKISQTDEEEISNPSSFEDPARILQKAISVFIYSSFLFKKQPIGKKKITEMIIHIHIKKDFQKKIYEQISVWFVKLKNWCNEYQNNPDSVNSIKLLEFLNLGFFQFENKSLTSEMNKNLIKQLIENLICDTQVIVLNSDAEFKKFRNKKGRYKFNNQIIIGAKLMERGVTYENLLTSFITRRAKNKSLLDTTLQRARWFGYRKHYQKLIRIFLTEQIEEDFQNIKISEQYLWIDLENIEKDNIPAEEWDISIWNNSDKLDITNPGRVKIIKEKAIINNFQLQQEKSLYNESVWLQIWQKDSKYENYDNVVHREIICHNDEDLKKFFLTRSNFLSILENKLKISNLVIDNDIFKNFDQKNIPIKIILMDSWEKKKTLECRHPYEKSKPCKIMSLHKGAPGGWNKGDYMGDYNLHKYSKNRNKFILQVYKINIKCPKKGEQYDQFFYAFKIPKKLISPVFKRAD